MWCGIAAGSSQLYTGRRESLCKKLLLGVGVGKSARDLINRLVDQGKVAEQPLVRAQLRFKIAAAALPPTLRAAHSCILTLLTA